MTITLHAQPYDLSANGFYFSTAEEYTDKVRTVKNAYGDAVEEFEIQFIDGEALDCALAKAIGITQANVLKFLELVEDLEDWKKINLIIAVGEIGYDFDPYNESNHDDIELYRVDNMRELAEQFVEEGLFGDIPERLQFYIDYDAIARDLAFDYSEIEIAGERLIYRAC